MKICRAPFRVSLFGGGTDFEPWYSVHGSYIVSFSIDRYCYVTIRKLAPFFDYKYRISWSKIETPMNIDDVQHKSIKACLKYLKIQEGLEIHTDGDLPARSGLGSSSTFTAAFLGCCHSYLGTKINPRILASETIKLEQDILKEAVGVQDQIQACHGGFNIIRIGRDGNYSIYRLNKANRLISDIEQCLVLVYSGIQRFSTDIQQEQLKALNQDYVDSNPLTQIHSISKKVSESILLDELNLHQLSSYLRESWEHKSTLMSEGTTKDKLLEIYSKAIESGAFAGKLLGAGGGGFFAFFVSPEEQPRFIKLMSPLLSLRPSISESGIESIL